MGQWSFSDWMILILTVSGLSLAIYFSQFI